ncbi:Radixin [Clonorchis sinensis]|uniref:Radixin n=1 Tax=Clonorchis sinensis TaxID=79923 RepID=A0A3R7FK89_CLOSI|nr:Radixin [Clonorchis sinensis]
MARGLADGLIALHRSMGSRKGRIRSQYSLSDEEWETKIAKWHEQHGDLSKQDAIMEYLKVVQDLEMYGVTYFPIKNNKQTPLWLGVDALGLNIYEQDDRLTPKINFPWNEIRKLQYSHTKFSVKPSDPSGQVRLHRCFHKYGHAGRLGETAYYLHTPVAEVNTTLSPDRFVARLLVVRGLAALGLTAPLWPSWHGCTLWNDVPTSVARGIVAALTPDRYEKLLAERRARELMEERYLKMERAMQEQELAYEISQSALTDYQRKVKELEAQLEEEKRIHQELKDMQNHLEEVNRQLEMQSAASYDERARLAAERDAILAQIEQQRELIQAQEEEKRAIEAQLALGAQSRLNGDERRLSGEQELEALDNLRPDNERQAMAVTDIDYAKRLEIMRLELDPARDRNKLQQVDIRYEENISRGMDKYRTLHAIRQGNTKKRVEQFESM